MGIGKFFLLLKQSFREWSADKAPQLGAAVAYYTVFSIGPLLLVILAIIGFFLGQQAANGQLFGQLQNLVGPSGAAVIQHAVKSAHKPTANIFATIIGIIILLLGASGLFGQLKEALNTIWHVQPKPGRSIVTVIFDRFLNLAMVGVIAFLLLVSLVASTIISALSIYIHSLLPFSGIVISAIDFVISFIVITILFAFILKVLPDVRIPWKSTWIGAIMTTILFLIGQYLISLYISKGAVGTAYGSAGSLIAILVWVYYSAQILFFGAEFTKFYAINQGTRITPSSQAVFSDDLFLAKEKAKKAKTKSQVTPLVGFFLAGLVAELGSRIFRKKKK